MELVVKGRGTPVVDQLRRTAEHRAVKLARLLPRAIRLEIEVGTERGSHSDGMKRLDGTLEAPRRTFRAKATAPDAETALDLVLAKLERQVRDHHDRRTTRVRSRGMD